MNGDVVGVYCPPDSDHEEEYFWLFNIKRASSSRAFGHWYNIQGKGIYKKGDADPIYLRNIIRPAKKLENFLSSNCIKTIAIFIWMTRRMFFYVIMLSKFFSMDNVN